MGGTHGPWTGCGCPARSRSSASSGTRVPVPALTVTAPGTRALTPPAEPLGLGGCVGVTREPLTLPSQKSWPAQTHNTEPWPLGQWGSQEVHGEGRSEHRR